MNNKDVQLSKKLSWVLRHAAIKERIPISAEGYVEIQDLLKHPSFSEYILSDIVRVVNTNSKRRYKIRVNPVTDNQEIKANQGHSIRISDEELTPITQQIHETVVHGTYLKFWPQIKSEGLCCMNRKHIHFAKGTFTDTTVVSGMRRDVDLHIFVKLKEALDDGLKFFESENGVILTPGNADGFLPTKYFDKVIKVHSGESIWQASL